MNSPEDGKPKADGGQPRPEQPGQAASKAETQPRSHLRLIAGVVALVLVIGFFVGMIPHWRQSKAAKTYTQQLATNTVAVVSPAPGKPDAGLMLPAEVRPWLEASIFAQVSGYLKTWLVDIGAQVKEGQVLAEIDTPEVDQQLEQARAQLVLAQANLKLAEITDERWQAALKLAAVSEQEAAEKSAARAVMAANVQAMAANVHRLEAMQSFQHVTASFAGTVTLRNVDIGDLIVAGSGGKQLFHLAQTEKLRVYVRVPEPDAPGVSPPGSYGQVRLTGAKPNPRLVLPSNALLFRAPGLQVWIVGTNNTVELRQVQVGRDFGQTLEILSGVTPADRVIVNPPDSLVNGTIVRVAQSSPSAK